MPVIVGEGPGGNTIVAYPKRKKKKKGAAPELVVPQYGSEYIRRTVASASTPTRIQVAKRIMTAWRNVTGVDPTPEFVIQGVDAGHRFAMTVRDWEEFFRTGLGAAGWTPQIGAQAQGPLDPRNFSPAALAAWDPLSREQFPQGPRQAFYQGIGAPSRQPYIYNEVDKKLYFNLAPPETYELGEEYQSTLPGRGPGPYVPPEARARVGQLKPVVIVHEDSNPFMGKMAGGVLPLYLPQLFDRGNLQAILGRYYNYTRGGQRINELSDPNYAIKDFQRFLRARMKDVPGLPKVKVNGIYDQATIANYQQMMFMHYAPIAIIYGETAKSMGASDQQLAAGEQAHRILEQIMPDVIKPTTDIRAWITGPNGLGIKNDQAGVRNLNQMFLAWRIASRPPGQSVDSAIVEFNKMFGDDYTPPAAMQRVKAIEDEAFRESTFGQVIAGVSAGISTVKTAKVTVPKEIEHVGKAARVVSTREAYWWEPGRTVADYTVVPAIHVKRAIVGALPEPLKAPVEELSARINPLHDLGERYEQYHRWANWVLAPVAWGAGNALVRLDNTHAADGERYGLTDVRGRWRDDMGLLEGFADGWRQYGPGKLALVGQDPLTGKDVWRDATVTDAFFSLIGIPAGHHEQARFWVQFSVDTGIDWGVGKSAQAAGLPKLFAGSYYRTIARLPWIDDTAGLLLKVNTPNQVRKLLRLYDPVKETKIADLFVNEGDDALTINARRERIAVVLHEIDVNPAKAGVLQQLRFRALQNPDLHPVWRNLVKSRKVERIMDLQRDGYDFVDYWSSAGLVKAEKREDMLSRIIRAEANPDKEEGAHIIGNIVSEATQTVYDNLKRIGFDPVRGEWRAIKGMTAEEKARAVTAYKMFLRYERDLKFGGKNVDLLRMYLPDVFWTVDETGAQRLVELSKVPAEAVQSAVSTKEGRAIIEQLQKLEAHRALVADLGKQAENEKDALRVIASEISQIDAAEAEVGVASRITAAGKPKLPWTKDTKVQGLLEGQNVNGANRILGKGTKVGGWKKLEPEEALKRLKEKLRVRANHAEAVYNERMKSGGPTRSAEAALARARDDVSYVDNLTSPVTATADEMSGAYGQRFQQLLNEMKAAGFRGTKDDPGLYLEELESFMTRHYEDLAAEQAAIAGSRISAQRAALETRIAELQGQRNRIRRYTGEEGMRLPHGEVRKRLGEEEWEKLEDDWAAEHEDWLERVHRAELTGEEIPKPRYPDFDSYLKEYLSYERPEVYKLFVEKGTRAQLAAIEEKLATAQRNLERLPEREATPLEVRTERRVVELRRQRNQAQELATKSDTELEEIAEVRGRVEAALAKLEKNPQSRAAAKELNKALVDLHGRLPGMGLLDDLAPAKVIEPPALKGWQSGEALPRANQLGGYSNEALRAIRREIDELAKTAKAKDKARYQRMRVRIEGLEEQRLKTPKPKTRVVRQQVRKSDYPEMRRRLKLLDDEMPPPPEAEVKPGWYNPEVAKRRQTAMAGWKKGVNQKAAKLDDEAKALDERLESLRGRPTGVSTTEQVAQAAQRNRLLDNIAYVREMRTGIPAATKNAHAWNYAHKIARENGLVETMPDGTVLKEKTWRNVRDFLNGRGKELQASRDEARKTLEKAEKTYNETLETYAREHAEDLATNLDALHQAFVNYQLANVDSMVSQPAWLYQLQQNFTAPHDVGLLAAFTGGLPKEALQLLGARTGVIERSAGKAWKGMEWLSAKPLVLGISPDAFTRAYKNLVLFKLATMLRIVMADEMLRLPIEGVNPLRVRRMLGTMKDMKVWRGEGVMPERFYAKLEDIIDKANVCDFRAYVPGEPGYLEVYRHAMQQLRKEPLVRAWGDAVRASGNPRDGFLAIQTMVENDPQIARFLVRTYRTLVTDDPAKAAGMAELSAKLRGDYTEMIHNFCEYMWDAKRREHLFGTKAIDKHMLRGMDPAELPPINGRTMREPPAGNFIVKFAKGTDIAHRGLYGTLDAMSNKMRELVFTVKFRRHWDRLVADADYTPDQARDIAIRMAMRDVDSVMYSGTTSGLESALRDVILFLPAYRQFATYWAKAMLQHPIMIGGPITRAATSVPNEIEVSADTAVVGGAVAALDEALGLPRDVSWTINPRTITFFTGGASGQDEKLWMQFLPGVGPMLTMPLQMMQEALPEMYPVYKLPFLSFSRPGQPIHNVLDKMFFVATGDTLPRPFGKDPHVRQRFIINTMRMAYERYYEERLANPTAEIAKPTVESVLNDVKTLDTVSSLITFLSPLSMRPEDAELAKMLDTEYQYLELQDQLERASEKQRPAIEAQMKAVLKADKQYAKVVDYFNATSKEQDAILQKDPALTAWVTGAYAVDVFDGVPLTNGEFFTQWRSNQANLLDTEAFKDKVEAKVRSLGNRIEVRQIRAKLNARAKWFDRWAKRNGVSFNSEQYHQLRSMFERGEDLFAGRGLTDISVKTDELPESWTLDFPQLAATTMSLRDVLGTDAAKQIIAGRPGTKPGLSQNAVVFGMHIARLPYGEDFLRATKNWDAYQRAAGEEAARANRAIIAAATLRRNRMTSSDWKSLGLPATPEHVKAQMQINRAWDFIGQVMRTYDIASMSNEGKRLRAIAIRYQDEVINGTPAMKALLSGGVARRMLSPEVGLTRPVVQKPAGLESGDPAAKAEWQNFRVAQKHLLQALAHGGDITTVAARYRDNLTPMMQENFDELVRAHQWRLLLRSALVARRVLATSYNKWTKTNGFSPESKMGKAARARILGLYRMLAGISYGGITRDEEGDTMFVAEWKAWNRDADLINRLIDYTW